MNCTLKNIYILRKLERRNRIMTLSGNKIIETFTNE